MQKPFGESRWLDEAERLVADVERVLGRPRGLRIGEAPDINAEIFKREIVPKLAKAGGLRKTIYASSNDLALQASMVIHDFRRVGETVEGVQIFQGFDTIDASKTSSYWRAWGHSYLFDNPLVLADLMDAVVERMEVTKRKLKRRGAAPDWYWSFD